MKREEIYSGLRERVFKLKPDQMGISLENNKQVYAAVIDMRLKNALATLVCSIDGTISLYYSTGQVSIGLGEKEEIRKAGISLLISAGQCLGAMEKTNSYDIEPAEMNAFLLTRDAVYFTNIEREKLSVREIQFLNFLIQNVFTAIRTSSE